MCYDMDGRLFTKKKQDEADDNSINTQYMYTIYNITHA